MLKATKHPPVFISQCRHTPGEERNNIENILFLEGVNFFQQIFSINILSQLTIPHKRHVVMYFGFLVAQFAS